MFKKFCCKFCILLGAIWRYNPQYNPQHKCSQTRGGGGVKGRLNNVKKNRQFGSGGRPLGFTLANTTWGMSLVVDMISQKGNSCLCLSNSGPSRRRRAEPSCECYTHNLSQKYWLSEWRQPSQVRSTFCRLHQERWSFLDEQALRIRAQIGIELCLFQALL